MAAQDTSLRQSHLRQLLYSQKNNNCLDEADESPPASPGGHRRLASGPPTPKSKRPDRGKRDSHLSSPSDSGAMEERLLARRTSLIASLSHLSLEHMVVRNKQCDKIVEINQTVT